MPMDIPVYQLQVTQDSNVSVDFDSPTLANDNNNNNKISNKNIQQVLPVHAALQAKQAKKHNLKQHRSFNTLPTNINRPALKNPIRKNKSYGDQLINNSDDEYGLSLEQIYSNFNLNDPAVQKLKYLQNSMRRTQKSSADLEQLLSATPPSLPPTPKYDNMQLEKSKSNSLSITKYFPEYATPKKHKLSSHSNSSQSTSRNNYNNDGKMLQIHPMNKTMIIKEDVDDIMIEYHDTISPINDDMDSDDDENEDDLKQIEHKTMFDDNNDYNDNKNRSYYYDQMKVKKSVQLMECIDDKDVVAFAFPNPSHFDYVDNILTMNNYNLSKSTPTTPTPHKYNNFKQSNPMQNNLKQSKNGNNSSQSSRFQFGRERSLSDSSSKYKDQNFKNIKREYKKKQNHLTIKHRTISHKLSI